MSQEWERKDRDGRNLALLERAVAETPDDAFCHFNLGCQLACRSEMGERALAEFLRAIDILGPDAQAGYLPLCYILAGMALMYLDRPAEGLPYVQQALDRFPDLPDAHYAAGQIHGKLGDLERARAHYQMAIQGGGKPHGYLGSVDASASTWKPNHELGLLEMQAGRWERALEYFLKALHYKPDSGGMWANRGRCHHALGDRPRAIECMLRARALGFRDAVMMADLADLLAREGRRAEALEVAGEGSDPRARLRHGMMLVEAGRWTEALAPLGTYLAAFPDDADALVARGAAWLRTGHTAEARADLERACALAPQKADARHNLAAVAQVEGRGDEAAVLYREALALDPMLVEARMNLAALERARGNGAEAVALLEEARRRAPDNVAVLLDLGETLRTAGRGEEAAEVLREALRREPGNAAARGMLEAMGAGGHDRQ